MNTPDEYYTKKLYPLQDGILKIINDTNTPFYLTGGTALSRCYFHHRYSEDLDFFVNSDDHYEQHVRAIIHNLEKHQADNSFTVDKAATVAEKNFTQIIIVRHGLEEKCVLKIDLINDVAEKFGKLVVDEQFGRIDNVLNILSNKLTALYRLEPKDIADIWIISKNVHFNWQHIVNDAKEKEMGLDVLKMSELIKTFPVEFIDKIKWSISFQAELFIDELSIIAEDLFWGKENSLYP